MQEEETIASVIHTPHTLPEDVMSPAQLPHGLCGAVAERGALHPLQQ